MLGQGGTLEDWTRWLAQDKAKAAGGGGVGLGGLPSAPGGLPGAAPAGGYTQAAGGIPGVTDPATSFANLIAGITKNMSGLGGVISGVTGASNKALRDQYSPEYFDTLKTLEGNAGRRAKGDISDLIPGLAQSGAEAAVASGVPLSGAAKSKFTRDVLGSEYAVEQQALKDLGDIKNLTPTVAPYNAENLVPNIGMQVMLQQLADMLRGAPVPEQAYQRNMRDALAGLNSGLRGGYGGGARTPISSAGSPVAAIVDKYAGGGKLPGDGPFPNPPPPGGGVPDGQPGGVQVGGGGFIGNGDPRVTPGGGGYFDNTPNIWDNPFQANQWDTDPFASSGGVNSGNDTGYDYYNDDDWF